MVQTIRHHLTKRRKLPSYAVRPATTAPMQAVPSRKPIHLEGSLQLVHLPHALDDRHLSAEPALLEACASGMWWSPLKPAYNHLCTSVALKSFKSLR